MLLKHVFLLLTTVTALDTKPIVYLIRHGEKPAVGDGLTTAGQQRAQCLRKVLGAESDYKISHIMAQTPKITTDHGVVSIKRQRPLDTVKPLANDLGFAVDTSCGRDDAACVKRVIENYSGPGNILICWEHKALTDIVNELGNTESPKYPGKSYDLIWTLLYPYDKITDITSEHCPGLDA